MKINKKITGNIVIKSIYKFKTYIDIAVSQISWVTGKLPEIVSAGVLLNWVGFDFTKKFAAGAVLIILAGLFLFGYIWKKAGIYDVERYVYANIDPVQREILEAARNINEGKKWKKK